MMTLSPTKAGYMTLREAANEDIWLKGLAIESGFELNIVAGIDTCALSKAIPGPRFQHRLNLLSIGNRITFLALVRGQTLESFGGPAQRRISTPF
ncbi:hypothetical protein Tco_1455506 [Tanacetum coccineum]